ncbi:MAG: transcriptional regulator GcvA [Alphaproteobacteria bacterium]
MVRSLPPLNGLRAFEAAARLESFTKAAAELGVTQTAISRHVRTLEQALGTALFVRYASGIELTDDGRLLVRKVSSALDLISAAVAELGGQKRRRVLKISAQPNFAIRWLIPRLASFRARHPEIDVHVTTSHRLAEFPADGADVAIRLGRHWTGVVADRLFEADLFPVCSPGLVRGGPPLRMPADLARHTLLHVSTSPRDWRIWLDAAGVGAIEWEAGPRFDSYALALQAAVEGIGVAIGRRAFVEEDLAEGRLVQPFALTVPVDEAWFLICPRAVAPRREVRAFRAWIAEAARGLPRPAPVR